MRRWTDKEKRFVRNNAQSMTDAEIAEVIGRTGTAVAAWRRKNGVDKSDSKNFYKPWSKEEICVLENHWYDASPEWLREQLPGRSYVSMQAKASDLGLKRKNRTRYKPKNLIKTLPEGTVTKRMVYSGQTYLYINLSGQSIPYHRYRWEKQVGPIPDDQCLVCRSEDTTDADPSNWELKKISEHLAEYHSPGSRAGIEAFRQYREKHGGVPAQLLTDGFVASAIAGFDNQIKEWILENRMDLVRLARTNYKLKRELKEHNHDGKTTG